MKLTSDIKLDIIDFIGNDQYIIGAMQTQSDVPPAWDSDAGRIRYLMQHRHGTPFEHNCLIMNVRAPIFVWREWHRHRIGWSYNEESARYRKLEPEFFIPHRDRPMIKTPEKFKASRPAFLTLDEEAEILLSGRTGRSMDFKQAADEKYAEIVADMEQGYVEEYARYERQLARNLDNGLARDNLPVGIFTSCWVTCNLRSALAFLSLRTHDPKATYVSYPLFEIQNAAKKLEMQIARQFPLTHAAFCEFGRVGP